MTKIHPLTGAPINGHKQKANGRPRQELAEYFGQGREPRRVTRQTYDAARSGTDMDPHWTHADGLDADSGNSRGVRQNLVRRSRYEVGSNGYYCGVLGTNANTVVGVGPTLRMQTGSRDFNQLVEREFFAWTQAVQLRRKLWCMGHARTQDGEAFGIMVTNPRIRNQVQLDLFLVETEQCQTPFIPFTDTVGYIDGIRFDEFNNVLWFDVLRYHPGGQRQILNAEPMRIPAADVLHWFKLKRPGQHRGIPDLTSTLNVGGTSRRHREAVVRAAETAASPGGVLEAELPPSGDDEPEPIDPWTTAQLPNRALLTLPEGWKLNQMDGKHPNAQYAEFQRTQVSELARPLSMPYNAAACDSSTYSFASGKLDYLLWLQGADIERQECNDLVLDPLFAAWFREWTIVAARRDIPPAHQWDWPAHPIPDRDAENRATDTQLKNGTMTLRRAYNERGEDFEDNLTAMVEDYFGEATEENIATMRKILLVTHYPAAAQFLIDPDPPETPDDEETPEDETEDEETPEAAAV